VRRHDIFYYRRDSPEPLGWIFSLVHRIFEGTNEINRLVICGMLLRRAARGQLALIEATEKVRADVMSGVSKRTTRWRIPRGARKIEIRNVATQWIAKAAVSHLPSSFTRVSRSVAPL
jgi:hypothetical protein